MGRARLRGLGWEGRADNVISEWRPTGGADGMCQVVHLGEGSPVQRGQQVQGSVFTEQKGGRYDGEDGGWVGAEIRDVRAWSGGMDLALTRQYREPPAGFELSDQVSVLATPLTADGRWVGQGPRDSWVLLQESR